MTMESELAGLLPCPFCGKSVAVVWSSWSEDAHDEFQENDECFEVVCDAHQPNGPGGCGASSGAGMTPEEAVAKWNRRAIAESGKE